MNHWQNLLILFFLIVIPRSAFADTPVRVAVLSEHSGRQASFGAECDEGLAVARATAPKNVQIDYLYGDSQGKPKAALSEFRKLVEVDGAVVAIAMGTHICMPLKPIAAQLKIPLLCLSSHAELLDENPYLFRFWTSTRAEGQVLAEAFNKLPGKKVAFLSIDDEYPLSLAEHAKFHFEKLGGKVVQAEIVLPGETDVSSMVARIMRTKASGVFVNVGVQEVGSILRKFREQQRSVRLFSNMRIRSKGVADAAGLHVVEGVVFVDVDVEKPFFTHKLRKLKPNAVPASINYTCYAALAAAIQAVDAAATPATKESVHKSLSKLDRIQLLDGHLEMKDREAQLMPRLKVFRKGKVWTLPRSS